MATSGQEHDWQLEHEALEALATHGKLLHERDEIDRIPAMDRTFAQKCERQRLCDLLLDSRMRIDELAKRLAGG